MILIISEPQDVHAQAVMRALAAQGERNVRLLDFTDFPQRLTTTMAIGGGVPSEYALTFSDRRVPMREVKSVWWRRPQAFGLPQGLDPVARHFAMTEAATAFQGMWQASDCLWVNDIQRDAAAAHKPWQLELAQSLGLSIPETLITNEPEDARAFWQTHPGEVIYKPFIQSWHSWRETRILRKEEEALAPLVRLAPVIFQRYVPGHADLRVTVIGEEVFPAAAALADGEYPVDVRLNKVPYKPHRLPPEVTERLLVMMRRLGLEYGAIDLRLTPDGEYVFFEVNPAGQFLYIEMATGQPIAAALASRLAQGRAAAKGVSPLRAAA